MTPRNGSPALDAAAKFALALTALGLALGCGHTEEEWGWQQDKLMRAQGDAAAAQTKNEQLRQSCDVDRRRASELAQRAEGLAPLSATLEERERANTEYKQRRQAVEIARVGAELLNKKLAELALQGVTVSLRRTRLTITVPGDLLFTPFRGDTISKDGRVALHKIAEAVKSDPVLVTKSFQVVGFTDDGKHYDGQFKDAVGLSAMHAREVASALVLDGPLLADHFSAAGFGASDPVAPNDNDADRKKNRRVEITLLADEAPPPQL